MKKKSVRAQHHCRFARWRRLYNRDGVRAAIEEFIALGEARFRANLIAFLEDIIPVAAGYGVNMCVHPDDPRFRSLACPALSPRRLMCAQSSALYPAP